MNINDTIINKIQDLIQPKTHLSYGETSFIQVKLLELDIDTLDIFDIIEDSSNITITDDYENKITKYKEDPTKTLEDLLNLIKTFK